MSIKLFAFWKYDLFPYILGAEVIELQDASYANVNGYGTQYIKYRTVLSAQSGKPLKEKLQELQKEHHEATVALHTQFMQKRNELLKLYGVDSSMF